MQGNYISLVLHKIQCCSHRIYQLLLSSCHIGIFLFAIYGCTLAMYHCSYLISWQRQANSHSSLSCTLLQTTNRRNICILLENKAGNKHCSEEVGVGFSRCRSLGHTQQTHSPQGHPELTGSVLQFWPLEDCSTINFSSSGNAHQIPSRLSYCFKTQQAAFDCNITFS